MFLSRARLEINDLWMKQTESLVEADMRLRSLERASAVGDQNASARYIVARLRAGHDPVEVGGEAHRHGVHDTVRAHINKDALYGFDLGKHALHYAHTAEQAIKDFGPSSPFQKRDEHPTKKDHRRAHQARESLSKASDALTQHVITSYREDHPDIGHMEIFDRRHSENLRRRKLTAAQKAGASPHQLASMAHALSGGGTPARAGNTYHFPTEGEHAHSTQYKLDALRRVLPHAKISHHEIPHGLWGHATPIMKVDISPHLKD